MKLAGFEVKEVIYSHGDTVVARVITDGTEFSAATVIIKYQNTDYPSIELDTRWKHESKILHSINSEWIVKTHGLRQYKNSHMLVLEDFSSTTLGSLLESKTLTISQRLYIACELASAVAEVHRYQLIHRDINPRNILINPDTLQLKLCDFALATRLSHKLGKLTNHDLLGTFEYISPEQTGRTNINVDYRSDLYSLGITLYELFGGRLPFTSQNALTLLHCHIALTPEPLSAVRDDIPPVISAMVDKLMAKSPENRYQSAYGLLTDLKQCMQQWQKKSVIEDFPLAQSDVPQYFDISHKLYGRDEELAAILEAYDRSCSQRTALSMVSGCSGVGKSALVHELQKNIIANGGVFIAGKCDQYNRDLPFAVMIEALQQLMQQLMSESQTSLQQWRAKLQLVLGNNAAIITDLLPSLESIVGPPPPLSKLPPAESELRLHSVFSDFVSALYTRNQPLVIFLDDLQWADLPTLKLLKHQINDSSQRGLYIVGAYRDNEVDNAHPLANVLQSIEQTGALQKIHLQPLQLEHIQQLLSNTLRCDKADVCALAALCLEKTQGNPFFLRQFLSALYEENDIRYSHEEGRWLWHMEQISTRSLTDNVVDLMVEKLKRLDEQTQFLASIAAHLGNKFNMRQLSSACKYTKAATAQALWPLLQAGFILPLDEHYQFVDDEARLNQANYRFLHDRVQQAAYSLTPEEGREQLLLHIGRHWLNGITEEELETNLFTLLRVLNGAINIIDDAEELKQLLALNLRAGIKTKNAAIYEIAAGYLHIARKLLPPNAWQNNPEQTLAVNKALIESEFFAGNDDTASRLYADSISKAPGAAAKVSLILVQANQYQSQGNFGSAINVLIEGLKILGVVFPADELAAEKQLLNTFTTTQVLRSNYSDEQQLTAEKMLDEQCLLRMKLHNAMAPAFYLSGSFQSYALNSCNMVELTLKHGQCEQSSVGYSSYATVMSMMGEKYPACYKISKLATRMSDLWDSKYHRAPIYQYFGMSYLHWCEPIEHSFAYLDQVIGWGREGSNLVFASYAVLWKLINQFVRGIPLAELQVDVEQGLATVHKAQQMASENYILLGVYQALLALQGKTLSPQSFDTDSFNVKQFFGGDLNVPSMNLAFYTGAMIRHAFLMDDKNLQGQCLENIDVVSGFLPDSTLMAESLFYVSLVLLDADNADDDLARAVEICEQFQQWSTDSPNNYLHKYLLISAEVARVRGQLDRAMEYYRQATDAAEEAGFIHCEALINERYAKYWLGMGQKRIAANCIRDAHYLYARWGATAKCELLAKQWTQQRFNVMGGVQLFGGSSQYSTHNSKLDQSNSLDLHSLIKANQLLSGEIRVSSLLEKMMAVLMENAGAQRGAIIVNEEDQLTVEIIGSINEQSLGIDSQLYSLKLADTEVTDIAEGRKPLVPNTLIRYAGQTMETVLLDNPGNDPRFVSDSYLRRNKPKSVLCLPISGQGRLVGIVYMENNLTEKAFTAKHKDTVELIAAQAAVSLINARHYETLERKVAQRTEELHLLAIKDGLTDIFNRREFDSTLDKEWRRSLREGSSLSLLMIDIDHFKRYNDNYGHPEGDTCIKRVAQTLNAVAVRSSDFVARYGGEEFAILIVGLDGENVAQRCLEEIRALQITHEYSETANHITISIGISTLKPVPGEEPDTLIKSADVALYTSKQNGRNQYSLAAPA